MPKLIQILAAAAGATALGVFAAAPMVVPARAATEHTVDIRNFAFQPATLTIAVGDTVTWTNSDDAPHTATAENDAFDSGNLDRGQSFSFTFTEPGTYAYRCDFHSEMQGTIVVQAAQQPASAPPSEAQQPAGATASPAPTGTQPDTALPLPGDSPTGTAALLMGLGLVVLGVSVVRFAPRRVARADRPGGGWNR
ncbi:MAG TPA: plastocyanin/azurin family copper-binding protein [Candidatus Limnocylindria bacterium]|nr:plastocyanin/azurin family copper-binding protein [Candidatus Limnocylindria bacterium]